MPTWRQTDEGGWEYDLGNGQSIKAPPGFFSNDPNPTPDPLAGMTLEPGVAGLGPNAITQAMDPFAGLPAGDPSAVQRKAPGFDEAIAGPPMPFDRLGGKGLAQQPTDDQARAALGLNGPPGTMEVKVGPAADIGRYAALPGVIGSPEDFAVQGAVAGAMRTNAPDVVGAASPLEGDGRGISAPADPYAASIRREGALASAAADEEAQGILAAEKANAERRAADNDFRQQAMNRARQDFVQLATELEEISSMPTAARLSTGQQIASYIAAGVQGFLNPTGPNSAVAVTQQAIQNSVEEQMRALRARREHLQARAGLAKDRAALDAEEAVARDLITANEFDAALRMVQAEKGKYKSPVVQEEFLRQEIAYTQAREAAASSAWEKAQQQGLENELKLREQKRKEWETGAQIANARGRLGLDREKFEAEQSAGAALAGTPGDPLSLFDPAAEGKPAFVGRIGDEVEARKLKELIGANVSFSRGLGDLARKALAGRNKYGSYEKYFGSPEGVETKSAYEAMKAEYVRIVSGAAANDGEVRRLTEVVPEGTLFQTDPQQAWANFGDRQGSKLTDHVRARGLDYDFGSTFKNLRPASPRELENLQGGVNQGQGLNASGSLITGPGGVIIGARDPAGNLTDYEGRPLIRGKVTIVGVPVNGRTIEVPVDTADPHKPLVYDENIGGYRPAKPSDPVYGVHVP